MKKLAGILKWVALAIIAAPFIVYLVWLAGNLHNDELSSELSLLLQQKHEDSLAPEDNAYFDSIGLRSPENVNPNAWGQAWFKQAIANDQLLIQGKERLPIQLVGFPYAQLRWDDSCKFSTSDVSRIGDASHDLSAARKCLNINRAFLKRFDALIGKAYQEPYREMSAMSDLDIALAAPLSQVIKLAELRIASEIAQDRIDKALSRWADETSFFLRQARHSHGLITKLIATMALKRYQWQLADFISSRPKKAQSYSAKIRSMLLPFNIEALSLKSAFENEATLSARLILLDQFSMSEIFSRNDSKLAALFSILATPFFDRNATANALVRQRLELARIASLDGEAYRQALSIYASVSQEEDFLRLHNPIGHILYQASQTTDLSTYLLRTDDVVANAKLLNTAISLLSSKRTSSAEIFEHLKNNREYLIHAYTGELPTFNSKTRILSYPTKCTSDENTGTSLAITL